METDTKKQRRHFYRDYASGQSPMIGKLRTRACWRCSRTTMATAAIHMLRVYYEERAEHATAGPGDTTIDYSSGQDTPMNESMQADPG